MSDESTYLTAKRSVDDRALNDRVLEAFADACADRAAGGRFDVLDVGAGTGTMVARLAERELLPDDVAYRAVDLESDHLATARSRLPTWLSEAGYSVSSESDRIVAQKDERRLSVALERADALALDATADACIAAAFLDLVELADAMPALADHLRAGGLLYAPLTFDGATTFRPPHPLDERVERCYHRHMAAVRDGGGPNAGSRLLDLLEGSDADVLATGRSDQVIAPRSDAYSAREDLVLAHLLDIVAEAASAVPGGALSESALEEWLAVRRGQLERAGLTYVARNVDVLARF